jgi:ankyrin repeat protein
MHIVDTHANLPDQETINQFIIRCHFDLPAVEAGLAEYPAMINTRSSMPGAEDESPLGAAAHVGNRAIAEYLLAHGAELEFCAAVMLGMDAYVREAIAADPAVARATGAHGIPALTHAAIAGNFEMARFLVENGATVSGSGELHGAIHAGNAELVAWLIDLGADTTAPDFRGNTPLQNAQAAGRDDIVALLT